MNFDALHYVELAPLIARLKFLEVVDGINSFFIFFSLFYYTARGFDTLYSIAIFFVKIAEKIIFLSILMYFFLFTFGLSFYVYYSQHLPSYNEFLAVFISMYSLSFGNSFLDEDDRVIKI